MKKKTMSPFRLGWTSPLNPGLVVLVASGSRFGYDEQVLSLETCVWTYRPYHRLHSSPFSTSSSCVSMLQLLLYKMTNEQKCQIKTGASIQICDVNTPEIPVSVFQIVTHQLCLDFMFPRVRQKRDKKSLVWLFGIKTVDKDNVTSQQL